MISNSSQNFKLYGKSKNKWKILEVNNGFFTIDLTQNLTSKKLMFIEKTYPKLDNKLS